jgi:O-antigen/teichoic acid export membrane protein
MPALRLTRRLSPKRQRNFSSTVLSKVTLLYDGLYTFVIQSLTIVLSLALGVLTARFLGPAGKGIYALPIVQAGLVSAAFGGLSSATSYYLLNGNAGRHVLRPLALVSAIFVGTAAIALVVLAAIGHALWAAPAAIVFLPAAAAVYAVRGYVTGIKRIRGVGTLSVATVLATLLFTCVGFFFVARNAWVAIVAWVAGTALIGTIAWVAMVLHARRLPIGEPVPLRAFAALAVKNGAEALVSLLNYRADLYLVAIMLPVRDLGLYSVATSAPQALLFPAQVASTVTSPHIGSLERSSAARLAARCARQNALLSILICLGVFFLAPLVVRIFYGVPFLPLVGSLRILLAGVVALSTAGPIALYYTLKLGKPEIPLAVAGTSAAICIALTIALIPHLGIAGAAIASSAGYIIAQALALCWFKRSTGLGFRETLLPTAADFQLYRDFVRQFLRDASRLLRRSARLMDTGASQ